MAEQTRAEAAYITKKINELGDWRRKALAHLRQLIHAADSRHCGEVEMGEARVALHSRLAVGRNVSTGDTYQHAVKLIFASGAALEDPKKLFNSSMEEKCGARSTGTGDAMREATLFALSAAWSAAAASFCPSR